MNTPKRAMQRLAWALTLAFGFLFCVSALSALAAGAFAALSIVGVDLDYRIEIDVPLRVEYANSGTATDAKLALDVRFLGSKECTLEVPIREIKTPERLLLFICLLGNVATTYLLLAFLRGVRAGKPFIAKNAWRIRIAGLAAILSGFAGGASGYVLAGRLASALSIPDATVGPQFDWDFGFVVIGVLVILFGEVFRLGAYLQQEQDLTV